MEKLLNYLLEVLEAVVALLCCWNKFLRGEGGGSVKLGPSGEDVVAFGRTKALIRFGFGRNKSVRVFTLNY